MPSRYIRRTAAYWREQASEARLLAGRVGEDDRLKMLDVANTCDELAKQEKKLAILVDRRDGQKGWATRTYAAFGRATVLAAVALAAVAALVYQPALGTGSIAPGNGPSPSGPQSPLDRHEEGRAINQLAAFLERWTSTTERSRNE